MDWLQNTTLLFYLIVHCVLTVTNMTFKTMMGRACLHYIFNLQPQFLQKLINTTYYLQIFKTCIGSIKLFIANSPFQSKGPSMVSSFRCRQLPWTFLAIMRGHWLYSSTSCHYHYNLSCIRSHVKKIIYHKEDTTKA